MLGAKSNKRQKSKLSLNLLEKLRVKRIDWRDSRVLESKGSGWKW